MSELAREPAAPAKQGAAEDDSGADADIAGDVDEVVSGEPLRPEMSQGGEIGFVVHHHHRHPERGGQALADPATGQGGHIGRVHDRVAVHDAGHGQPDSQWLPA